MNDDQQVNDGNDEAVDYTTLPCPVCGRDGRRRCITPFGDMIRHMHEGRKKPRAH